MTLKEKCPILQFADLGDERGKLVVIEGDQAIPFDIKRVFYIYDSDSTVVRGQHVLLVSTSVLPMRNKHPLFQKEQADAAF